MTIKSTAPRKSTQKKSPLRSQENLTANSLKPAKFHQSMKFGILGGGQLARMLCLEAQSLGLEVHVLSEKATDPAAQVTAHWKLGDPNSKRDLQEFAADLEILTFESEFVDMDLLIEFEEKLQIFPSASVMKELQDRSSQKSLMQAYQLPTSPYLDVTNFQQLEKAFTTLGPCVLKKCRGGYDGYGTYYVKSKDDFESLQPLFPAQFIAEKLIQFNRELAVLFIRNLRGQIVQLPLVETQQTQSRCDYVVGPIQHPSWNSLGKKISSFVEKIQYVGAIAFELFETKDGLLINEIAPRVHNSGHYSQTALTESQFLGHIKAGLGLELNKPQLNSPAFVMVNLLGREQQTMKFPDDLKGHLHWYGKTDQRPGRKMGHLNFIGTSKTKLLSQALAERERFFI